MQLRQSRPEVNLDGIEHAVGPTPEGAKAEITAEGVTVYHDSWPVEIGDDWAPLLVFFGLDPDAFDVDQDSVRISKHQQSKGLDDGSRDVIWLYAYRARFVRKASGTGLEEDVDAIRAEVRRWRPRRTPGAGLGAPVTYVHQQGDEQTGKSEGGGLDGLRRREEDVLQRSVDRLAQLLKRGANVEAIFDCANGDRAENIFGQYASQARTAATLRRQLKLSRDMDLARTRALCDFGLPVTKAYTTSNHGEIRQVIGMAPFTSESDNLDLIIAESVRDVLEQTPVADQVTWLIPHDEWWTLTTLSGVPVGVTHGHKAGRKRLDVWVREQRDYLLFHRQHRMAVAFLGHKHHGYVEDIAGTWAIQTPSLDGGSPYFEALTGNRSASGAISLLVGAGLPVGWSELVVI